MIRIILIILLASLYVTVYDTYSEEYNANKVCDCIYVIEGKEKASQPYGIETIKCTSEKECRQICINTIENNKVRFKNQVKEKDYLTFLAKRYCPPNWKIWLKNLKFYLNKIN